MVYLVVQSPRAMYSPKGTPMFGVSCVRFCRAGQEQAKDKPRVAWIGGPRIGPPAPKGPMVHGQNNETSKKSKRAQVLKNLKKRASQSSKETRT